MKVISLLIQCVISQQECLEITSLFLLLGDQLLWKIEATSRRISFVLQKSIGKIQRNSNFEFQGVNQPLLPPKSTKILNFLCLCFDIRMLSEMSLCNRYATYRIQINYSFFLLWKYKFYHFLWGKINPFHYQFRKIFGFFCSINLAMIHIT